MRQVELTLGLQMPSGVYYYYYCLIVYCGMMHAIFRTRIGMKYGRYHSPC